MLPITSALVCDQVEEEIGRGCRWMRERHALRRELGIVVAPPQPGDAAAVPPILAMHLNREVLNSQVRSL